MRSDRAQYSRTEALNLIRNRKGRLPHIVVVTGEPLNVVPRDDNDKSVYGNSDVYYYPESPSSEE